MAKNYLKSDDQLDDLIIIEDSYLNLELFDVEKDINIKIMPNCGLDLVIHGENYKKNIQIEVGEDSILNYNEISLNSSVKAKITLLKNSSLYYSASTIAKKDIKLDLEIDHISDNSKAEIINHLVNVNGVVIELTVIDKVNKEAKNTESQQDNKIIDLADGYNIMRPIVLVDTDEVVADHSSYVGKFKDEEMFYLKSRGIDDEKAKFLLINGFLIKGMKLSSKDEAIFKLFVIDQMKEEYE